MDTRSSRVNYYDSLGVDEWVGTDDIRASYKRLALKYHPDKNPNDPDATAKFQKIEAAYSTLSDPVRRSNYDHQLIEELEAWLCRLGEKKKILEGYVHESVQSLVQSHKNIETLKLWELEFEKECAGKKRQKQACISEPRFLRIHHEAAVERDRFDITMKEGELESLKAEIRCLKNERNALRRRHQEAAWAKAQR